MTRPLPLELGRVDDPYVRRAFEQISLQWNDGTGAPGPPGPAGPAGPSGPTGPTGPTGPQGQAEGWWTGSGAPAGATGVVGDWYLDSASGDYYEKTGASAWTLRGNLKGPVGPPGPAGTVYDSDQIGTVKSFTGKTIPTNWMLADGRTLNRADYPQLADTLGVAAGAVTFTIPDLRSRFIYGAADPALADLYLTGGEAAHLLLAGEAAQKAVTTGGESASHSHALPANYVSDWTGGGNLGTAGNYNRNQGAQSGINSVGHTHSIAGSDATTAHNNLPPFIRLALIIKVVGATIDPAGALIGPQGPAGAPGTPADPTPIEGWHLVGAAGEPAFQNSWGNFGGGEVVCGFRKDPFGKVLLKGLVLRTGTPVAGEVIFTLPVGYRPPAGNWRFSVPSNNTPSVAGVYVSGSTGEVRFWYGPVASQYLDLDVIEFDTDTVSTFPVGPRGPAGPVGTVPRVTVLPSSPANGEECVFVADAANGILWRLRYNAGSASPYKWEVIGGSPLYAELIQAANGSTTSAAFTDLTGVAAGPSITLPLAGDYYIEQSFLMNLASTGQGGFMSYAIGATAAAQVDAAAQYVASASSGDTVYRRRLKTGLPAVTLTSKFAVTGSATLIVYGTTAAAGAHRMISAMPTRVG